MWTNAKNIYIKGYKIFRSDNISTSRKGVAILVSKELNVEAYKIREDSYTGRYVLIKLKCLNNQNTITIASAYLEPDQEKNIDLIPQDVRDADIFAGDLNDAQTNFVKYSKVYHIKNTGDLIKTIELPNHISDHPILIFNKSTYIETKNTTINIQVLDKNIIQENLQQINLAIQNTNQSQSTNIQLKNPYKTIQRSLHSPHINELNIDTYMKLKEDIENKYKELKNQNKHEFKLLIKSNKLDQEA
jgi:hypothetical protein